ncbi:hypothetical protein [Pedobacter terrae]
MAPNKEILAMIYRIEPATANKSIYFCTVNHAIHELIKGDLTNY